MTANSISLWVDGVPFVTTFNSLTMPTFNYLGLVLGGTPLGGAYGYLGAVDNVRIYNRVLSNTEVSYLYTSDPICSYAGSPLPPSPPVVTPRNYEIPLGTFNYAFTRGSTSTSKVTIGKTSCAPGNARLTVEDDNIGFGIKSTCMPQGPDNLAIRGVAGDPTSNSANNIFGVVGESNLSPGNPVGTAASIVSFCGPLNTTFIPPGQHIAI